LTWRTLSEAFLDEEVDPTLPAGVTLSYESLKSVDGSPAIRTKVMYKGQPIGTIMAMYDPGTRWFKVVDSSIESAFRGKGIMQAAYREFHKKLQTKGSGLTSDTIRSHDANSMWNALRKKGLARGPKAVQGGMVYFMEALRLLDTNGRNGR